MKSMRAPLAALLLGLAPSVPAQEGDEILWHTDLALAKEFAAANRAPLLVVFRCEA